MGAPLRTVHLRRTSSSSPSDVVVIAVDGGGGVDLARVGLALGLDPTSVRLNGYFLSRGPRHVCSAVTWGTLLAFFAARGLPTGAHAAAPVAVHGKPAAPPAAPTSDFTTLMCSKRKSGPEVERCPKKRKPPENRSAQSKPRDDVVSNEIVLGLKRGLRLEDTNPAKKFKQVDYRSETQQPVKFSCSFVNDNGKRPWDDEMVTSLPCKRVR